MNEVNYGKCRDLSVIWEFSKLADRYETTEAKCDCFGV